MASNHTGRRLEALAQQFPGRLQHLIGPESDGWRRPVLPYALDNGAYVAWSRREAWSADAFLALCDKAAACGTAPRWVVCPDVVGDASGTFHRWDLWADRLRSLYGWPIALAVQDGMKPADVRTREPDLVFVGGSTVFKWATYWSWAAEFPRVHVGRVNRVRWALDCRRAGVESIDGTGWMRTDRQRRHFLRLLQDLEVPERQPIELF